MTHFLILSALLSIVFTPKFLKTLRFETSLLMSMYLPTDYKGDFWETLIMLDQILELIRVKKGRIIIAIFCLTPVLNILFPLALIYIIHKMKQLRK